jgi:methyl-accepting chemotaxis protein
MKNITISKRLIIMVLCSIVALIAVGAVGLSAALKAQQGVTQVRDDSLTSIKTLGSARNTFQRLRVSIHAHVLNTDDAAMDGIEKEIKAQEDSLNNDLKTYEKMLSNDEDRKILDADRQMVARYLSLFHDKLLPKSRKNETTAALAILSNEMRAVAMQAEESLNKHVAFNENMADNYANEVVASVSSAIKISIGTIVVAVLIIGVMGYLMLTNIRGSLNHIRDRVSQVESNLDFTLRITVQREDEIGVTAHALNRLLDKLQGNLKSILERTHSVAQSASQMASTSGQVAVASHQQSEAASNMAATVEEMTVSINHVGDRAQEADRISTESGSLASSGEAIIGRTVNDIHQISNTVNQAAERIRGLEENSQQISGVIAVIKEVADQTNLLALNAAIEAARAGEQGRGFAVVADEVRKLAERTATSTQEISSTIQTMRSGAGDAATSMENVVDEVGKGVASAQEANEAISKIGQGSRNAVEIVEEIASAIREQASAMTSIAQQVERIAQMSEESSAAAGNSAQIAKDLDNAANEMQQIVSAYRL